MNMRLSHSAATIAIIAALSACASRSTSATAEGEDPTTTRLLAAADAAATSNGGQARRVEAVRTTRGRAAELTGHSNQNQAENIWVVQISGDRYVCGACSVPPGAAVPRGDYITFVLRASDFTSTDGGIGPHEDLAALGDVMVLREGR